MNALLEVSSKFITKILSYIPNGKEALLNEIDKIEKRMAEIDSSKPYTTALANEYARLADRKQLLNKRLKNSTASS